MEVKAVVVSDGVASRAPAVITPVPTDGWLWIDVVATAGHCLNAGNFRTVRFVFGFRMQDAATAVTTVPNAQVYRGVEVPEVLRSGDHGRIARWREEQALERTRRRRPDLSAARGSRGEEA